MNSQKVVWGEGNEKAKIWLIGECPGVQEERLGKPFCGGSGRVLDGILQEAQINRKECYVDNVVQKRPPGNNFGIYYKDKSRRTPTDDLLDAHTRLKRQVQINKPNVVIALGNEALFALTDRKYIMKWRGSILGCHGVKVIPTVHPAMVMRQYEFKPVAVLDFKRALRESKTPEFPEPYHDQFLINPTYDQVMDTIAFLHKQPYVAFDIETGQNQIMCIGFAWSKTQAICVPIFFGENSWWTEAEELAIIRAIKKLFANPKVKFIAQNAQFDMVFLKDRWDVDVPGLWMDTMIAFHCVYPELRKGLDFLCSIYTNRPYYKGMLGQGGPENLWTYNCLDTVVTYECAFEIRKELKEFGTLEFYQTHSHKLVAPLIEMQRRGVKIDLVKRAKIDNNLAKEEQEMEERLEKAVGHLLNVSSPKQMKDFLYKEMKLPPQRNRKTGSLTADEDALQALAKKFPSPIFDLILDIRKVRHMLSNYIRAKLDADGRLRCSYIIGADKTGKSGPETGRLSSRKSVYGTGTNLQNIDKSSLVRCIFIPDDGKMFVNADASQAEARVVAYLSKESRMQALFEQGGDIHTRNAAMIFNKQEEAITKDERDMAKALVHACLTPNHKVLTLSGWVNIQDIKVGDKIAEWSEQGISFVNIQEKFEYDYSGDVHRIQGRGIDVIMTPRHRIPYKTGHTNPLMVCLANCPQPKGRIPVNGKLNSTLKVDPHTVRLAAAIQADATIWENRIRFHVVNQRKIDRLKELCEEAFYSEKKCLCHDNGIYIDIPLYEIPYLPLLLDVRTKTFTPTVYKMSAELRNIFLDEITLWDGFRGITGRKEYKTTNRQNAELVQIVAHLSNKQSLISTHIDKRGNRKPLYIVSINNRKYARINNSTITKTFYSGKVYSLSVPSTFFLVKYNDKISVTGNSHYGIGARRFAKEIGSTENRARELLNQYFAFYPGIKVWHKKVGERLRKSRIMTTPFGRKRMFFGRWGPELIREALAYVPQSTVGDLLNLGIIRAYPNLPPEWYFALQLHDAVLMQVPLDADPMHIMKFLKHYFEIWIDIDRQRLKIPVDVKVGSNWAELKPLEV